MPPMARHWDWGSASEMWTEGWTRDAVGEIRAQTPSQKGDARQGASVIPASWHCRVEQVWESNEEERVEGTRQTRVVRWNCEHPCSDGRAQVGAKGPGALRVSPMCGRPGVSARGPTVSPR
jgi:hypothetical protein